MVTVKLTVRWWVKPFVRIVAVWAALGLPVNADRAARRVARGCDVVLIDKA